MKHTHNKTTQLPRSYITYLALIAGTLCSSAPLAKADYESEILSENPLAYFRFNDGVATDDVDAATNLGSLGATGRGSYSTTIVHNVTGALAAGTNAAGRVVNSGMSVLYQPALNNQGSFTVEVWLKPSVASTPGLTCAIASVNVASPRMGWLIYQGTDTAGFNFRTYNKNATSTAVSISSGDAGGNNPVLNTSSWYHVAAVWDDTAKVGKIYVNGVLEATSPVITVTGTATREYEANTDQSFTIGARSDGAFAWAGDVDEPAYYNTALSDSQIAAHYNNGVNASPPVSYDTAVLADSPVGYWRLGEPVFVPRTPPVADNSGSLGNSADGGYVGGAKNTLTGPDSASGFLGFGASNSALALKTGNGNVATALALLSNRSKFTVTGWVKRGATKSTRGGYFGQNDTLEFGDAGSGTLVEAWNSAAGQLVTTAPYPIPDNTWGQITYTADGTSVRLYINGVQVTSLSGNISNYGSSPFNFNIGGGGVFNATGDYFLGEIDEVAVFDKALSTGRVKQLYDVAVGTIPPTVALAPTITPGNVVAEGLPYTLTVDPAGTPPFTYQWKKGGIAIPGAESITYTVPNAVANSPAIDPFEYTCEVTNSYGSVTSPSLFVYVTPALVWDGTDTNPTFWDVATTANWKPFSGGAVTTYSNDFSVVFSDAAVGTNVALTADVEPQSVLFSNNAKNITLTSSANGIGGATGISKTGTGNVTILSNNYFTGSTSVSAGTLTIGNGTDGAIAAASNLSVTGGSLDFNFPDAGVFGNPGVISAGQLRFSGTGSLTLSGASALTGNGTEVFDRAGVVSVGRPNQVKNVSILQGEVVFNGSQEANRLAVNANVTVAPGAAMTIRGVNALPTAANSANITLNQSILKVVTNNGSHGHLLNLTLNQGTIVLASDAGGAYNGESFQLNGDVTVTGSAASTITFDGSANASNSGVAIKGTRIFDVANVTGDTNADLIIAAELEAPDDGLGNLTKNGNGTMFFASGIAHSYPGTTNIAAGTLVGTGSVAGPLVLGASSSLEIGNGIGSFAAKDTTINGTLELDINGTTADLLSVNGNLSLAGGSTIHIDAIAPTANYYILCGYTGTLVDSGVTVTGVPSGYNLVFGFNSILISKSANFSPTMTIIPSGTPTILSTNNFDASDGSFAVSDTVSAQTDWTYSAGSWRSNGQSDAFGSNNVSYLTSPAYTLTQSGTVELTFSHRHSFEFYAPADSYDAGVVELSVNGAAFQRVPLSAFTQNGYNGTVMLGTSISLAGQQAFIGNSAGHPGFITSKCKLVAGQPGDTVRFRFMSASDNNTSGDLTPAGWEVDSYEIKEGAGIGGSISWPLGILEYSDNLQPPWTTIGSGGGPIYFDPSLAPKRFYRIKP